MIRLHESDAISIGAMEMHVSLLEAIDRAGGRISWEELRTMTVPELELRLGSNGIRFGVKLERVQLGGTILYSTQLSDRKIKELERNWEEKYKGTKGAE